MNMDYKSALDKMELDERKKNELKELYFNERRMRSRRKNAIIRGVAAAACIAAAVAFAVMPLPVGELPGENRTGTNASVTGGSSGLQNSVTITAYAKELTPKGKVYAVDKTAWSRGMFQDKTGEDIMYVYDFPIRCKGKNIDRITYRLDNGFFVVYKKPDIKLGITGERGERYDKMSSQEGEEEEEGEGCFTSISMDYDNQPEEKSKDFQISIMDDSHYWSREKQREFKAFHYDCLTSSNEETKRCLNFAMKDLGLKCIVTYKDGTTETKEIELANEVKKWSEICELDEGDEDGESVFLTYSLK